MRRLLYCLALVLQILTWVPATSRLFSPDNDLSSHQLGTGGSPKSSYGPYTSGKREEASKEARYTGVKKVGSRPPDCEHKCEGCIPCEAIQVPTITSHFSLQYANYEPESWKCKCGLSFYSP